MNEEKIYNRIEFWDRRKSLRNFPTVHEIILWKYLRRDNLGYKFRRQQSIGPYIVDFLCRKKQLIIEIDGNQHNENWKYDQERTSYLNSLGYEVLRFWNNDVENNLETVVNKILATLKSPPLSSGHPLPGKGGAADLNLSV